MADKSLIEQMLDRLVNEDQSKAEELFHEYVVQKSREIYEELIESEISEEDEEEKKKAEDDLEEASDDEEKKKEDDLEEEFEDIAIEADDDMDLEPGDPGDKLASELGDEEDDGDMEEKSEEELFQDLDSIVDELQAKFDELKGGGDDMGDMGGDSDMGGEMKDAFDPELETVREYVEKVANPKAGDNGANAKSIVAGKNDMGGTASNIAQGGEEPAKYAGAPGGQLSGSSLFKGKPTEENFGNINVPGGKAGSAFSKKEPGHGAEKKGEAEGKFSGAGGSAGKTDTQSLFRGRR